MCKTRFSPRIILASLVAGLLTAALPLTTATAEDPKEETKAMARVGETAPSFRLTDTHGKEHGLEDFKGKIIVLEWLNHDCPFVRKHYESGNMQKLQREAREKGIVWLTINSSAKGKQGYRTAEEANELTTEKKAEQTALLLDTDGKVGRMYGAKTTPHMYVIDKDGVLVYAGAIDSISSAKPEDVAKADNYVKAALDDLVAGRKVATPVTQPYGCSVKY